MDDAPRSPELTTLLGITPQVRESGSSVSADAVAAAKAAEASDVEIHDTVLIAGAYVPIAENIVKNGYTAETRWRGSRGLGSSTVAAARRDSSAVERSRMATAITARGVAC
ncbi:hypothetical protein ALI22I_15015 [Saccharothrix sp. ALI-22-I]|uniref:hypothetical protein n=1 Tax=Saccharothrix sp. ALI-22-I TaxID=1933778 RepID=UPI00097C6FD5|nr:hypothetical protein [Saccharothrix sp. ALI-22-I]ONI89786.1 hypothetical protein ALI22I_15015 [Saccharothrix sp. ALI-22-I]